MKVPASFFIVFLTLFNENTGQYRGEECTLPDSGQKGVCKYVRQCEYAIKLLRKHQRPVHCSFELLTPVVCCPKKRTTVSPALPPLPTPTPPLPTPTPPTPAPELPVPAGPKYYQKCVEYNTVLAPKRPFTGIYGGVEAKVGEFPHMALLGFGEKADAQWLCGGTLISENFVVTAAHCLYHREYGRVNYIRLGELNFKDDSDTLQTKDLDVVNIYQHPDYTAASHYHDIALVEMNEKVTFAHNIKPACLFGNMTLPPTPLTITGWGLVSFLGDQSSHLLKAVINRIDLARCSEAYKEQNSRLANGILEEFQICAGDPEGKDTCPGDSGGPIQFKFLDPFINKEYFSIVGITSFGRGCGIKNSVGVYTRVAPYISWIEGLVWKQ